METEKVLSTSWKIKPLPKQVHHLFFNKSYSDDEIILIQRGFLPQEMEDKWIIYFENNFLYLHRSWTGFCIYKIEFDGNNTCQVLINKDSKQYEYSNDQYEIDQLNFLIDRILLHKNVLLPKNNK